MARLIQDSVLTEDSFKTLEVEIAQKIEESVKFGEESPLPDASEFLEDVYVSY